MKYISGIFLIVLVMTSCSSKMVISNELAENEIRSVMAMQEKAWSDGDIDQFMEGYWKSEDLSFVGRKGVSKGWTTTKENYKKGYPSKDAMGKLTFDILEMNRLSEDTYHMIGKYKLERKEDTPSGYFTLIWKYIDEHWVIVSDQTSG